LVGTMHFLLLSFPLLTTSGPILRTVCVCAFFIQLISIKCRYHRFTLLVAVELATKILLVAVEQVVALHEHAGIV
jgi:hypothetical protein